MPLEEDIRRHRHTQAQSSSQEQGMEQPGMKNSGDVHEYKYLYSMNKELLYVAV